MTASMPRMSPFSEPVGLASQPYSAAETADLKQQIFAEARRMSNDQLLELADALHAVIRARQAIRRTHGIEHRSFAPRS